ncbi:MAG: YfhO family protein [Ignavibacteriae bacterium]|nr:YfhO family protein [Ignavibacteriota bacterium]MCB9242142.1 YfhO family protein [Ignavibacteriales bacterium]
MAKSKAKSTHKKQQHSKTLTDIKKSQGESPFEKYQDYIYIGIIVLAILIFFGDGIFGGKIFASPDNLSPYSFKTFLEDAKANGIFPLWLPYIFGGMPSLASLTMSLPASNNFFSFIWDNIINGLAGDNLFKLTVPYYFLFAISTYFYIRYKFKNNTIALFCALCGVLATGTIQLIIVGHHTKMMTFSFFPLILLTIDKTIDSGLTNWRKYLIYLPVLAILMYMQLHFHHIQMLFYAYMMIAIYYGYTLIYKIIKKEKYMVMVKAGLVLIAGGLIAVAMDANIILSVKEYNKYSIRGQANIEQLNNPATKNDSPLDYQYATNWSFSPGEVMTFILPYYYGFGNVEVNGQRANTYWGQMPFTDSPVYFGVIVFLLALVGIFMNFRKNVSAQALTIIVVFFLFLSFGRTWPIIFDLFFYHFPLFGSFRAPVMIHYFLDFAFLILAGYGFKSILDAAKDKVMQNKFKKLSFVLMGLAGLMFIISLIGFEGSYKESVATGPKASELKQQGYPPQQVDQYFNQQIAPEAYKNVTADMRLHSILLLGVLIAAYFYTQKKLSPGIFGGIVIMLAVFDLWNISSKTLHWDNAQDKEQMFAKSDYVNFILTNDPDTYRYRTAEYSGGKLTTNNFLAFYRLHQFNGYQGAKIRNYQDAIDVAGDMNPILLDVADVKYLITDKPLEDTAGYVPVFQGTRLVYENKNYLPRAFFVDEYKIESGINILNAMKNGTFDPKTTALLEEDPGVQIQKPDSGASITMTDFEIQHIKYDVNATGNNMLVFSEIYYPAGWNAYIDGQETKVYKTDYLFRSIVVPAGQHKVEFKFEPQSYATGKSVSLAANIFVVLLLIAGIGGTYMGKKKGESTSEKKEDKQEEEKSGEESK